MSWDMLGAPAEVAGAIAVVVSLVYLSRQVADSNRLARADASRTPNSDLNMLNASFGTNQAFPAALRKAIEGEGRPAFEPDDRVLLDLYLVSITNLYEQLADLPTVPQRFVRRRLREATFAGRECESGLLTRGPAHAL